MSFRWPPLVGRSGPDAAFCDGPIEGPQAWLKKNGETLLQYGS